MAVAAATPLVTAGLIGLSPVAAHASTPNKAIAQIEVSANCDSVVLGACDQFGGDGGIWFWAELDSGNGGVVSGAECGHTVGGAGGPGGAGAGPINGPISWSTITFEQALKLRPFPEFLGTFDSTDSYYLVSGPMGTWLLPAVAGHYSVRFGVGIQAQITVAP